MIDDGARRQIDRPCARAGGTDDDRVVAGNARGKTGKVLKVYPEKSRIIVEGVNIIKRHSKPSQRNPQGGIVQHQETDIEVQCLPSKIPEYIEVDMLKVEIGQIIHLSDITLPEGVASVALALGEDHDLAVASIIAPRGGSDAEEEAAAPEADAGEAEDRED